MELPKSIPLAVHPIREVYDELPRQKEIQRVLDNPQYQTTLGLNMPDGDYTLYVTPRSEIYSPPAATLDIIRQREFQVIEPYQFLPFIQNDKLIEIILMGGEISESGIQGCVFGAYSDIIKWFKSPGNGTSAEELTIRLPYETLFTAHQKRFRSSDPDILETFKGQFWRNDLEQASFTQEEAIFNFRR